MIASDFHVRAADKTELETYRPLSGAALTALLLGFLSPLALFSPYLFVLPLCGVIISVIAVRRISARAGELSGGWVAGTALVLSCFFGAWGVAQPLARTWIVAHQAKQFCDGWLQLMAEDRIYEAYQWSLEPQDRVSPTISLEAFFSRNEAARKNCESFCNLLPFPASVEGASLKSFRYLGNASTTTTNTGDDLVVHRYEIEFEKDGAPQTEAVLVSARRYPPDSKFVHWQFRRVQRDLPTLLNSM